MRVDVGLVCLLCRIYQKTCFYGGTRNTRKTRNGENGANIIHKYGFYMLHALVLKVGLAKNKVAAGASGIAEKVQQEEWDGRTNRGKKRQNHIFNPKTRRQ